MTVPPGKGVTATTAPGHCTIRHVSLGPHVSSVFYLSITLCLGPALRLLPAGPASFEPRGGCSVRIPTPRSALFPPVDVIALWNLPADRSIGGKSTFTC